MNELDNNKLSILLKKCGLTARDFFDVRGFPHHITVLHYINNKLKTKTPRAIFYLQKMEPFLEESLRHKLFPIAASARSRQNKITREIVAKAFSYWNDHGSLEGFNSPHHDVVAP